MEINLTNPAASMVPKLSQHDKLVEQTRKWVGLSFFGPILDEMRKSPFASKMMDGGDGGKAFSQMYDAELAQRMSRGAGNKLVNAIVNRIEAKNAYAKQKSGARNVASGR